MFEVIGDNDVSISWTKRNAQAGFLVAPDVAGHVSSLKHGMFGALTQQTPHIGEKLGGHTTPYKSNGFEALAYLDEPENGGNGNGQFDPGDRARPLVRVWFNRAHNGDYDERRKPDEIRTLDKLGITAIDVVNYTAATEVDAHGNPKSWVSTLSTNDGNQLQIYDVHLVVKSLPSHSQ
jgi:hypothetical protein